MKSIIYVSKVIARQNGAMIPTGFAQIVRIAQRNNAASKITGVLSYRRGYYFQVLEGDDNAVDALFAKIKLDQRHGQVNVILNAPISKRYFPQWDMKLLESVNKDRHFQALVSEKAEQFSALSNEQRTLLGLFYKIEDRRNSTSIGYEDTKLMLTAWPDFSVIKQSPVIMELCARLTRQAQPYSSLLNGGQFGTKQQLDKILDMFGALEILNVIKAENQGSQSTSKDQSSGFYSKMKNFLNLSRG
jgi:hypothetical protein